MTSVADKLKRVPLFAELNGRQLTKLAAQFRERIFEPGTSVVQEGTMSGVGFFVIADGEAAVSVRGKDVATLSAGDHFGEVALVSEAERTATVTARTQLRCLEIPFWDFREFALQNPDVTWKLLQHVVEVLSADKS
ncbi:MAG: cyclic nucleotide-binding domain-containing protein [Gaiellaceae bacterium]